MFVIATARINVSIKRRTIAIDIIIMGEYPSAQVDGRSTQLDTKTIINKPQRRH